MAAVIQVTILLETIYTRTLQCITARDHNISTALLGTPSVTAMVRNIWSLDGFLTYRGLCVQLFNSVKVTELPLVWERAFNSAYHLQFCCLLRYVSPSFLLMFRTSFGF